MHSPEIEKQEFIDFLKWCLPKLNLRWSGFRKVHGTVRKRLTRRLQYLGLPDLAAYREMLGTDSSEWRELDRLCRIPISRFFRDKSVFEFLAFSGLPECAEAAHERGAGDLRVLSAGCASGEEPYTISLIWHLLLSQRYPDIRLKVLALDIDDVMLERAKRACYSRSSLKDLPPELLTKGFTRKEGEYCLQEGFRQGLRFEKADLRKEVPAGPFDLILCRNIAFTYFGEATQAKVFAELEASLRDGGLLVIGSHETLPPNATSFLRVQPGVPVFRKNVHMRPIPRSGVGN